MFAEVDPSIFSVIIQGGSFAVLAWLIIVRGEREREERRADREQRDKERDEREKDRQEALDNFRADREADRNAATSALKYMIEVFKEEQTAEREACERRHAENLEAIRECKATVETTQKETRHALANMASAVSLKQMADDLRGRDTKTD